MRQLRTLLGNLWMGLSANSNEPHHFLGLLAQDSSKRGPRCLKYGVLWEDSKEVNLNEITELFCSLLVRLMFTLASIMSANFLTSLEIGVVYAS